jgi:DnaJ-class molecular chaperone
MGSLIAILVLLAGGYLVSLRLHPYRKCRSCKGTGRNWGSIYKYSLRACSSCGGNGRRARLGVSTFHRNGQVWGERKPGETVAKRGKNFGR